MVMTDSISINGTDVTTYRIRWKYFEEWDQAIDMATLHFSPSVASALTLSTGLDITIQRGLSGSQDEYVFRGTITQIRPDIEGVGLVCKSPYIDAVKEGRTKSWDKDIDTAAGVGSEIFKDICDHSEISYSTASITSTGTNEADKLIKLEQRDDDDFDMMNQLGEYYKYAITYDYDNDVAEFHPKGFITYPVSLTVGTDIVSTIEWKENMEQMQNKIKIEGATVYDKIVPAGLLTTDVDNAITLTKTPEDTEVRQDNDAGTLYTRGQKNLGTVGVDFDYYVDEDRKKIYFSGAKADIWVRYGAQVPMPVIVKNQTSIDAYGGVNKIPHFKKYTFNDIKDVTDAENRGNALLQKYSTPFIEAKDIYIHDDIISANGNIKPGNIINIIDNFTVGYSNVTAFVKIVEKSFPHTYDKATVGDKIWRTEDWQAEQMIKINSILNQLNKNQDFLVHRFDFARTAYTGRRYTKFDVKDRSGDGADTFILGHPTMGILGTAKLGDKGTAFVTQHINQGQNKYREFLYDTTFKDSGSTTGTWDTTNKEIVVSAGEIAQTSAMALGTTYTYYTLSGDNITTGGTTTGLIEISGDGKATWETVTLDARTAFTAADTTGVHIRYTGTGVTFGTTGLAFPISFGGSITIANGYNQDGSYDYDEPAIYCFLEE